MFMKMLDVMINMLGPDMTTFTEVVFQLGAKHSNYDVKSVDFPVMGKGTYMREKKTKMEWDGHPVGHENDMTSLNYDPKPQT